MSVMNKSMNDIPPELKKWLEEIDIKDQYYLKVKSNCPLLQEEGRNYILIFTSLSQIVNVFYNHDCYLRKPSPWRINELPASVSKLNLLSLLTRALLPKSQLQESKEIAVLLAVRHGFEAIKMLKERLSVINCFVCYDKEFIKKSNKKEMYLERRYDVIGL